MNHITSRYCLLLCGLTAIFACGRKTTDHKEEEKARRTAGDSILIRDDSPVNRKLKTIIVEPGEYISKFMTTGIVKPLPEGYAEVSVPFEGRILKSFVKLGQWINAGAPLFEVSSEIYFGFLKNYQQSKKEKEMAESILTRKKELYDKGICSKRELEEAGFAFETALKEMEKSVSTLHIYNLRPDDTDLKCPLIIKAPITGEIVKNQITIGQYIKSDAEPVMAIANLNKVWVIAHVKEKDLVRISPGVKADVFTESNPDTPVSGTVMYVGSIMEETTRSVEVFLECNNREKKLKSGMFVTIQFYNLEPNALILPSASIMQDENNCFVYIMIKKGVFIKRKVTVSSDKEGVVIVKSGIEKGNAVVTDGGLLLQ